MLARQLDALEKGLSGAYARRRQTLLNRFSSSFVLEVQATPERHVLEGLPDQQAALEGPIEAFLDEVGRLAPSTPDGLLVERDAVDLAPDPQDSPYLRRLKRRRRLRAWLLRRPPRYTLRTARLER